MTFDMGLNKILIFCVTRVGQGVVIDRVCVHGRVTW